MLIELDVDVQEYGHCPYRVYEYGNKLAMCCLVGNIVDDDTKGYNIIMWVIEEYGGESGKSYRCTARYKFGAIYDSYPLCIWRNEIVCRYSSMDVGDEDDKKNSLRLFNLISNEWNKFPNFSPDYDRCAILNYEKSLGACLRHMD